MRAEQLESLAKDSESLVRKVRKPIKQILLQPYNFLKGCRVGRDT